MDDQRLDKWLWCARFFKTRPLASEAVKAGRVEVNRRRAKPAKTLTAGDRLLIRIPPYTFDVEVLALVPRRVSAPLARTLYAETTESREARARLVEQLKLGAVIEEPRSGKLGKKARRAREALRFTVSAGWRAPP